MDYRERSLDWATEILSSRWQDTRFRLELEGESLFSHRRLGRQIYRATFRVWERAGTAEVSLLPGRPARVSYPLPVDDRDPCPESPEITACEAAEASDAAIKAASPQRDGHPLRVREVERGSGPRSARQLLVHLEEARPDGRFVVELDPRDASRIGYDCPPFCRGSTRSAALGRFEAVKRARAALALPTTHWVAYASLKTRAGKRVWLFRFEVRGEPERGWTKATLNARTGALCEFSRIARQPAVLVAAELTREKAEHILRNSVRARLGKLAQLGEPGQGAALRKGKLVPAWLSVVVSPRGVYRATLAEGRVGLKKRALRSA